MRIRTALIVRKWFTCLLVSIRYLSHVLFLHLIPRNHLLFMFLNHFFFLPTHLLVACFVLVCPGSHSRQPQIYQDCIGHDPLVKIKAFLYFCILLTNFSFCNCCPYCLFQVSSCEINVIFNSYTHPPPHPFKIMVRFLGGGSCISNLNFGK